MGFASLNPSYALFLPDTCDACFFRLLFTGRTARSGPVNNRRENSRGLLSSIGRLDLLIRAACRGFAPQAVLHRHGRLAGRAARAREKKARGGAAGASAHFPIVAEVYPNRVTCTSTKCARHWDDCRPRGFPLHLKELSCARRSSQNNTTGRAKAPSVASRLGNPRRHWSHRTNFARRAPYFWADRLADSTFSTRRGICHAFNDVSQ
jgi:hypothetical protein